MQPAVIFDIDGTLADYSHRRNIILENPYAWESFFSTMGDDTPNCVICDLYNVVRASFKYQMIIVSGRPDRYRKITEEWLFWNGLEYDKLYLRKDKDVRSDVVVKQEIARRLKQMYNIAFVIEDRSSVVQMWREEGIVCLQCHNNE